MELNKAIQSRKSVRKFNNKKPDWRKIIECIDSARYAPMAGNNYSLKFILVDDENLIKKISEFCNQDFITKAKYIVVACSNPSRTLNEFGKSAEKWVRQQAGAAIENFLLKITEYGLSTCWVGYFNEDFIKSLLEIPSDVYVEGVFPIGYQLDKPKTRKVKIDLDRILYFNKYLNKNMKFPKHVD